MSAPLQSITPLHRAAIARFGEPVGVEQARTRWGELVAAAEAGTVTLIALDRSGPEWAALAPVGELAGPVDRVPAWSLTAARPKLGDLVREISADYYSWNPQVLTRHGVPVAVLASARMVLYPPPAGDRLDVDDLLYQGATITLDYNPGWDGATNGEGEPLGDPDDVRGVIVIARDPKGTRIGSGFGETAAEALRFLAKAEPEPEPVYSDEPPF
jgi:prevent-host-death family protein